MRALLVVGPGSEDLESIVTFDILRRAKLDVTIASIGNEETIRMSMGSVLKPATNIKNCENNLYDIVAFPGGPGCFAVADHPISQKLFKRHLDEGKIVGAICAAPAAFSKYGLLKGKRATCYPSTVELMSDDCIFVDQRVVIDDNLITSKGPGTAIDFALALVRAYRGDDICENIRRELRLDDRP